jgi:hypothetical protein
LKRNRKWFEVVAVKIVRIKLEVDEKIIKNEIKSARFGLRRDENMLELLCMANEVKRIFAAAYYTKRKHTYVKNKQQVEKLSRSVEQSAFLTGEIKNFAKFTFCFRGAKNIFFSNFGVSRGFSHPHVPSTRPTPT